MNKCLSVHAHLCPPPLVYRIVLQALDLVLIRVISNGSSAKCVPTSKTVSVLLSLVIIGDFCLSSGTIIWETFKLTSLASSIVMTLSLIWETTDLCSSTTAVRLSFMTSICKPLEIKSSILYGFLFINSISVSEGTLDLNGIDTFIVLPSTSTNTDRSTSRHITVDAS